jgi:two-component system, OmpR family, copper resistance phosphate regulon response regulator CusR
MQHGPVIGASRRRVEVVCRIVVRQRTLSRVLIAEDEPRLASFLEKGLRAAGHTTTVCRDGVVAASMARDEEFDVLILDLGLPGQDGLDVLRDLRARKERLPVLVLTARTRVEDTVAALDEGADDYLTKPFAFDELLARVRARVRSGEGGSDAPVLLRADLRLDLRTRKASLGDTEIQLTAREFTMLATFVRHAGQVLSRDQLLSHVWGHDAQVASNIVDVYVGSLRRKLGADCLETVRGLGYRLPTG